MKREKRHFNVPAYMLVVMIVLTAFTAYLFNNMVFISSLRKSPPTWQPLLVISFLAFSIIGIGGWLYTLKKIRYHR